MVASMCPNRALNQCSIIKEKKNVFWRKITRKLYNYNIHDIWLIRWISFKLGILTCPCRFLQLEENKIERNRACQLVDDKEYNLLK